MIQRIVVVQVVLYLLLSLIDLILTLIAPMRWWHVGSVLALQPQMSYLASHPWSLVTYIIPHHNSLHLLGCMLLLLLVKLPRQLRLYPWRILVLYIYGALVGALSYLLGYHLGGALGLWTPLPLELVGASTAVFTLLSASLTLHIYEWRELGRVSISGALLAVLLGGILLWGGLGSEHLGAHLAHGGCVLLGVIFALLLRRGTDLTAPLARVLRRSYLWLGYTLHQAQETKPLDPESEALLTKLRHSGYASLTPEERRRLRQIGAGQTKHTH